MKARRRLQTSPKKAAIAKERHDRAGAGGQGPVPEWFDQVVSNTNDEIVVLMMMYGRQIVGLGEKYGTISTSQIQHDINRYCQRLVSLVEELR